MDELKQRIEDEKPHIIAITEVNNEICKLNPEMIIYNIPKFQIFSKNVPENGRGILIYTHNSLNNMVEVATKSPFQEALFLSISVNKAEKLLVIWIYRSNSGAESKNGQLNELIKEIGNMNFAHKLIMGDFNYKHIDWEFLCTTKSEASPEFKFLDTLIYTYMFQHVKEPTRYRENSRRNEEPSILDLIITDEVNRI